MPEEDKMNHKFILNEKNSKCARLMWTEDGADDSPCGLPAEDHVDYGAPEDFPTSEVKSPAIEAFLRERMRQITDLGYNELTDFQRSEVLLVAGDGYISWATRALIGVDSDSPPYNWPLKAEEWKPNDNPWRTIEKGVALIAAGYDEMMREEHENG